MGKSDVSKNFKSQFERILKIDNLIRNKEYPTTKQLSEKLELSERQIQRLVKMMMEDFNAPILKDKFHADGFCYGLEGYSITNIAYGENETFALHVCSNIARRTLRGSNIYQKLDKGLTNLQNFAESYDTEEGAKLAERVQFAIDTNPIGDKFKKKKKSFENDLLYSIKEGQLLKISIKNLQDDTIFHDTGLPIMIAMYGEYSWILVYIKKDAFSDDFTSVKKLSLENLRIVDVSSITALNPLKNDFAETVFIKNNFAPIGESAVLDIEEPTFDGVKNLIGIWFSLSFPNFEDSEPYTIYADFYYDYEKCEYKLEESIEYTILNGVFRKGEDFSMSSKSNNDVENDLIYPEM